MSADIKAKYGTSNQTITISPASLSTGAARESNAISNTTNLFLDATVVVSLKSPASGTSASGYIRVWVYESADGGSTYTGGATGSDAAITLTSPPNMRLLGTIAMVANGTTYKKAMSLAAVFLKVPEKWGIVIENQSGGTLDTTGGNHSVYYQGDLGQTV